MTEIRSCCANFAHAQEDGTDNEGWGKLIDYYGANDANIGSDLPPIKFCPWCGTSLKDIS